MWEWMPEVVIVMAVALLVKIALVIGAAYVAFHFITKYW